MRWNLLLTAFVSNFHLVLFFYFAQLRGTPYCSPSILLASSPSATCATSSNLNISLSSSLTSRSSFSLDETLEEEEAGCKDIHEQPESSNSRSVSCCCHRCSCWWYGPKQGQRNISFAWRVVWKDMRWDIQGYFRSYTCICRILGLFVYLSLITLQHHFEIRKRASREKCWC